MRAYAVSLALLTAALAAPVTAKLPPPSEEAKAKAPELAAKAAWAGKVDAFQLCKAMDRTAARYLAEQKQAGKEPTPTETPACADPGAFVYAPPAAASGPAPAKP